MPTDPKTDATRSDAGVQVEEKVVSTPSTWKKSNDLIPDAADGFIVDLPSGNVIRMTRTMDMPILLQQGRIPNPLAGIVQKMIDKRSTDFPDEAKDNKVLEQLLDLVHNTIVRAVLEPPFDMPAPRGKVINPDTKKPIPEDGSQYQERLAQWQPTFTATGLAQHKLHEANDDCDCERKISVWDMDMADRFFIFSVAQGAAADLATFRQEPQFAMADVQASKRVRKPTKRTGGTGSKKAK